MKLNELALMSVLRWKPLKSSVQKARALTGALEAINIIISGLVGLLGVIALFSGSEKRETLSTRHTERSLGELV